MHQEDTQVLQGESGEWIGETPTISDLRLVLEFESCSCFFNHLLYVAFSTSGCQECWTRILKPSRKPVISSSMKCGLVTKEKGFSPSWASEFVLPQKTSEK
jgi:hypothetical protein